MRSQRSQFHPQILLCYEKGFSSSSLLHLVHRSLQYFHSAGKISVYFFDNLIQGFYKLCFSIIFLRNSPAAYPIHQELPSERAGDTSLSSLFLWFRNMIVTCKICQVQFVQLAKLRIHKRLLSPGPFLMIFRSSGEKKTRLTTPKAPWLSLWEAVDRHALCFIFPKMHINLIRHWNPLPPSSRYVLHPGQNG